MLLTVVQQNIPNSWKINNVNDSLNYLRQSLALEGRVGQIDRLDVTPTWNPVTQKYELSVSFQNKLSADGKDAFAIQAIGNQESAELLGLLYGIYGDNDFGLPSEKLAAFKSVLAGLKDGCDRDMLATYFEGHGSEIFYNFQQAFKDSREINLVMHEMNIAESEPYGHCDPIGWANIITSVERALLSNLANVQEFKDGAYSFRSDGTVGPNYLVTTMPQGGSYDQMAKAFVKAAGYSEAWFKENKGSEILEHFKNSPEVKKAQTDEQKLDIAARKAMLQLIETMKNIFISPNMGDVFGQKPLQPVMVITSNGAPNIESYNLDTKKIQTERTGDTIGLIVQSGEGYIPDQPGEILVAIQSGATWRQVITNILDLPNIDGVENFRIYKDYMNKVKTFGELRSKNGEKDIDFSKPIPTALLNIAAEANVVKFPAPPSVIKPELVISDPF